MTDLEVAIAVAEAGAAVVRRHFGAPLPRIDKGAGDFATPADVGAEHAMLAVLRGACTSRRAWRSARPPAAW